MQYVTGCIWHLFPNIRRVEYGKYIVKKFSFKEKKQISFNEAEIIGSEIINLFNQKEFDKCILFYNNFKNVITQIPQAQQIIPADSKSSNLNKENLLFSEIEKKIRGEITSLFQESLNKRDKYFSQFRGSAWKLNSMKQLILLIKIF